MVMSGTGTGPTPLGAFDKALLASGVADYNLIRLSSVVPPGSKIQRGAFMAKSDEYGHRLYVVMAHQTASESKAEAWAGLGWVQEPEDGRGLFVEDEGRSALEVRQNLETMLTDMMANRGREYGKADFEMAGLKCQGDPVCALVIAVYMSSGWQG